MTTFLVYLFCLVVGFVFVLVSAIFGHVLGGHAHVDGSGGHAEAGGDNSDSPGVSFFSPIIMAAFVTAFGAFGMIFSQFEPTQRPPISAPLAVLGAFVIAYILVFTLRKIMGAADCSSESQVATLVGHVATVISPIPDGGVGEIAYVQAGTRYTAPARNETGKSIANGQTVTITRVIGPQFYVSILLTSPTEKIP
ncbi:MAG TPA: NfeD family protein [Verrucomicrobiae bacterium]|jgi:membrane protein implicated in regulation of membrane protease activity|nr:NfeD family protein [Verrucomicrobiae bacterium]